MLHVDGYPTEAATAADALVSGLATAPWGQISPSVYETGRLVALAPWLTGHGERIGFLTHTQRTDGGWGGPEGYALAPTLSATEAVFAELSRHASSTSDYSRHLARVADGGLRALVRLLVDHQTSIPDTPAIELIVPALIDPLNQHLAALPTAPIDGLEPWAGARLPLPTGLDRGLLSAVRSTVDSAVSVPAKLLHSLEIMALTARGAAAIVPATSGTVGASPAATAAWLAASGKRDGAAVQYLEQVADRHDGPVPSVIPITAFEYSWVISTLIGAGILVNIPPEVRAGLTALLGESGTPGGEGLPPDSDTTSVVLLALAQIGDRREPSCLWEYDSGTHFHAWPGERTPSTSLNAHVLETMGGYAAQHGLERYADAAGRVATWLVGRQQVDGSWSDKWHASPYYSTACCTRSLHKHGSPDAATAVDRAAQWVLATQRADGSWGRWQGTAEETAYALQILLLTRSSNDPVVAEAIRRGDAYLSSASDDTALWHDKDLYRPAAVVDSAVLAAQHLVRRRSNTVPRPRTDRD